ncbi:MAG: MFS transporter [Planctomycetota bacterium]
MITIWLLTAVSLLFGVATGLVNAAAPQAVQALQLSSVALGLVGAGVPAGYMASCLLCGRFFAGMPAKRVLLGGAFCGALSLLLMAVSRTSQVLVAAQLLFGLASGAMWPFCSAWILEFESATVSKARLLRQYNVSWTAGTALGMYVGGLTCNAHWVFETFYVSAAICASAIVLGALAREPQAHGERVEFPSEPTTGPHSDSARFEASSPLHRVTLAALIAAVLFNFTAIGTKIVIAVNYAELNQHLGGGADRMGLLMAVGILSQLAAFGTGKWYESFLGLRRVYIAGALILIAVNWTYARSDWLPALVVAEAVTGFVLAMAYQCAILAFTARSENPRAGTTLLEASVGAAGLAPLAAGALSESLKGAGYELLTALRAPFYAGMGLIAVVLLVQLLLVPKEKAQRKLMGGNA